MMQETLPQILVQSFLVLTIVGIILCSLDDLFIDFVSLMHNLKPDRLDQKGLAQLAGLKEKRIAIIVANWHEEEVISAMIRGNLNQVKYSNYTFFLGVYPNDLETWAEAKKLEKEFSQVQVVVNSLPGPTSKGQMLNQMVHAILRWNQHCADNHSPDSYDLIMMQDSEDVLHPLALQVANQAADENDFVQFPVFSFERKTTDFIGGSYLDEFAEVHLRDLLVRAKIGAAIPSAGVGTMIGVPLAARIVDAQGDLFMDSSLTEDYVLGLSVHKWQGRSSFRCLYQIRPDGSKDFIATREYFPNQLGASIRQKTRWTVGIVFQSTALIDGPMTLPNVFFFLRDKKGLVSGFTFFFNLLTLFLTILFPQELGSLADPLLYFSISMIAWRTFRTFRYTLMLSNWKQAFLSLLRQPVRSFINSWAAVRATYQYSQHLRTKESLKWEKTKHLLPEGFGNTPAPPPAIEVSQ